MRPTMLWRVFIATVLAISATRCIALEDEYRVITISERSIRARMHVEAESEFAPREWFAAAAQPPELERQQKIKASLSPGGRSARELSSQRRPILVTRVKNDSAQLNLDIEYTMTLLARSLVRRAENEPPVDVPPLSESQRAMWLSNSPMCSYRNREFQRWLDEAQLRKRDDENTVKFGRRVFQHLRTDFKYEYLNDLDRRLTYVCREKKSDCLGLCALFVSVLRASEVPARILVGRWAQSAVSGETLGGLAYAKEHVKCEFHAPDVGWIPVDPATALLQTREHVSIRQFGLDTADFVTLHVNDQLVVQPVGNTRKTLPFLQGAFVGVITLGRTSEIQLKTTWQVEPALQEK